MLVYLSNFVILIQISSQSLLGSWTHDTLVKTKLYAEAECPNQEYAWKIAYGTIRCQKYDFFGYILQNFPVTQEEREKYKDDPNSFFSGPTYVIDERILRLEVSTIAPITSNSEYVTPKSRTPKANKTMLNKRQSKPRRQQIEKKEFLVVKDVGQKVKESNGTTPPMESEYHNDDVFYGEDYLTISGSHGLHFSNLGNALVFDAIWDHFIVIPLPKYDNNTYSEEAQSLGCEEFLSAIDDNVTNHLFKERQADYQTVFNHSCNDLEENIKESIKDTLAVTQSAMHEFRARQLKRNKREPITLTIGGAILAGGSFLAGWLTSGNDDVEELDRKVNILVGQLATTVEATVVLKESLIGITRTIDDQTKLLDKKIDLLKNTTEMQTNNLAYILGTQIDKLAHQQWMLALMSLQTMYKMIRLSSVQNMMTITLDSINLWDDIFADLRRSVLSHSLVGWSSLRPILEGVQNKVEYYYELGIGFDSYQLYYLLPLVSYAIREDRNELWIHLQIPLKRARRENLFKMIALRPKAFPCFGSMCNNYTTNSNPTDLISFDYPSNVWLLDYKSNQLTKEANKDDFYCQITGSSQICFTFHSHALSEPTTCGKAIHDWNEFDILNSCKFSQKNVREYDPISLGKYKFVIHRQLVPNYFMSCIGREPYEVKLDSWAAVIKVESHCEVYMSQLNKTLLGPYSGVLTGSTNFSITTYHSTLLEKIQSRLNDNNLREIESVLYKDSTTYLRTFNSNEYSLQFEWDNSRLTAMSAYLYKTQNEIASILTNFDKKLNWSFRSFSILAYVSLFGDILRILSTLIVIFGILTYTRFLGMFVGSVVILHSRSVQAYTYLPEIDSNEMSISAIVNYVLVFIFFILLIFYIKCAWFRTINISTYYGKTKVNGIPTKFSIVLNLYYKANHFRQITLENVFIRVPLRNFRDENFFDMKVTNQLSVWLVNKEKNLQLSESVQIYAVDKNGTRCYDTYLTISIPIKNIKWNGRMPEAINSVHNHDLAVVSIIRKQPNIQESNF
jgi:hypothetical protein